MNSRLIKRCTADINFMNKDHKNTSKITRKKSKFSCFPTPVRVMFEWFNPDCPTFDRFYIPIVPQAF